MTINLNPKAYLPESLISGNMSLNLLRKRIQLRWVRNCFSGEYVTWFLWCNILGLLRPVFSVWIGCYWIFSCILVIFLSKRGPFSLIILLVKEWLVKSFKDSLFFSSGIKHFRIKSFRSSESDLRRYILFLLIYSINCFSLEHDQGAFPWSIS